MIEWLRHVLVRDRARWARPLGRSLAVLCALLFLLTIRVITASRAELAEADRLRASEALDAAIVHYRRAARWYAPGNPYSSRALDHLTEIATEAEAAGDRARALSALRSIRGAILASRSVFIPHRDRLAAAEERIATLMGAEPATIDEGSRSARERAAAHLALLRDHGGPSHLWSGLALVGLFLSIAAAAGFLTRGLDDEDRLVPSAARLWGALWIVGFGAFVIGLALA